MLGSNAYLFIRGVIAIIPFLASMIVTQERFLEQYASFIVLQSKVILFSTLVTLGWPEILVRSINSTSILITFSIVWLPCAAVFLFLASRIFEFDPLIIFAILSNAFVTISSTYITTKSRAYAELIFDMLLKALTIACFALVLTMDYSFTPSEIIFCFALLNVILNIIFIKIKCTIYYAAPVLTCQHVKQSLLIYMQSFVVSGYAIVDIVILSKFLSSQDLASYKVGLMAASVSSFPTSYFIAKLKANFGSQHGSDFNTIRKEALTSFYKLSLITIPIYCFVVPFMYPDLNYEMYITIFGYFFIQYLIIRIGPYNVLAVLLGYERKVLSLNILIFLTVILLCFLVSYLQFFIVFPLLINNFFGIYFSKKIIEGKKNDSA